jgi:hypothetical protein
MNEAENKGPGEIGWADFGRVLLCAGTVLPV